MSPTELCKSPSSTNKSTSIGRNEDRAARYSCNSFIRARRRGVSAISRSIRGRCRVSGCGAAGSVKSNTPDRHAQRSAAPVATAFRSFDKTQNSRGRAHRLARASRRELSLVNRLPRPSGQCSRPMSCAGPRCESALNRSNRSSVPIRIFRSMDTRTAACNLFSRKPAASSR